MQDPGATSLRLATPSDPVGPDGRLAELVAHLTGCAPTAAVDAVAGALGGAGDLDADARLEVVAHALVAVRKRQAVDLRERRPA